MFLDSVYMFWRSTSYSLQLAMNKRKWKRRGRSNEGSRERWVRNAHLIWKPSEGLNCWIDKRDDVSWREDGLSYSTGLLLFSDPCETRMPSSPFSMSAARLFGPVARCWTCPVASDYTLLHFLLTCWRASVTWRISVCASDVTQHFEFGSFKPKMSHLLFTPTYFIRIKMKFFIYLAALCIVT